MDNLLLDYLVIALYFAVMIGAGYWGLRRARSADDYLVAVAPRSLHVHRDSERRGARRRLDHRRRSLGLRERHLRHVARLLDRHGRHSPRHPHVHPALASRRLHRLRDAREPLRGGLAPDQRDHHSRLRPHDRRNLHHRHRHRLQRRTPLSRPASRYSSPAASSSPTPWREGCGPSPSRTSCSS